MTVGTARTRHARPYSFHTPCRSMRTGPRPGSACPEAIAPQNLRLYQQSSSRNLGETDSRTVFLNSKASHYKPTWTPQVSTQKSAHGISMTIVTIRPTKAADRTSPVPKGFLQGLCNLHEICSFEADAYYCRYWHTAISRHAQTYELVLCVVSNLELRMVPILLQCTVVSCMNEKV